MRTHSSHIFLKVVSSLCLLFLLNIAVLLSIARFYDADIRRALADEQSITAYIKEHFSIYISADYFSYQRNFNHWKIDAGNIKVAHHDFEFFIQKFSISLFILERFFATNEQRKVSTLKADNVRIEFKQGPNHPLNIPKVQENFNLTKLFNTVSEYVKEIPYFQTSIFFLLERKHISLIPLRKPLNIELNNVSIKAPDNITVDIDKLIYSTVEKQKNRISVAINSISHYDFMYKNISVNALQEHDNTANNIENWNIDGQIEHINMLLPNKDINYPTSLEFAGEMKFTPMSQTAISFRTNIQGDTLKKQRYTASTQAALRFENNNIIVKASIMDLYFDLFLLGNIHADINTQNRLISLSSSKFKLQALSLVAPSIASQLNVERVNGVVERFLLEYDYAALITQEMIVDIPKADIYFDDVSFLQDIHNVQLLYAQSHLYKTLDLSIPQITINFKHSSNNDSLNIHHVDLGMNLLGNLEQLEAIEITTGSSKINNALFNISGIYDLQEKQDNNLKVQMTLSNATVQEIKPLLNKMLADKADLSWMYGITSGDISKLDITLEDTLEDINKPLGNSPKLTVVLNSNSLRLYPYKDWNEVVMERLTLIYKERILWLEAEKAIDKTSQLQLDNPTLLINFKQPDGYLNLQGSVYAKERQVINFINSSPIAQLLGAEEHGKKIDINGDINGELKVLLSFDTENPEPVSVNLDLNINKALLAYEDWQIHQTQGTLNIQDNHLRVSSATGLFANKYPVRLNTFTSPAPNSPMQANYVVHMKNIEQLVDFATGNITFSGQAILPLNATSSSIYTIESSLEDGSYNLFSSLIKERGEKLPFKAKLVHHKEKINIDILHARHQFTATYDLKDNHIEPYALTLNTPHADIQRGGHIAASLDYIDINRWVDLVSNLNQPNSTTTTLDMPTIAMPTAFINSKAVRVLNSTLNQVTLDIKQPSSRSYTAQLLAEEMDVNISWVEDKSIDAQINKFHWSWNKQSPPTSTSATSRIISTSTAHCFNPNYAQKNIPKITLYGKDIKLNNTQAITLSAEGALQDNALAFKQIQFKNSHSQIDVKNLIHRISATSETINQISSTTLDLNLKTKTITPILQLLGVDEEIYIADNVNATGTFSWQGAPWCVNKNNLHASLKAKTGIGSVTGVEPGIGRLLTLLNLKILLERFSDNEEISKKKDTFAAQGLSFSKTKLDVMAHNNLVTIKSFRIDSPIAVIKLHGEINSSANEYDLIANIRPEVLPTLLILTAILGGPVTGALAFISSELLSLLNLDTYLLTYDLVLKGTLDSLDSIKKAP